MTKWEKLTIENRKAVIDFLEEHHISACELAKISKELCACGTCYFFVQHYDKDGNGLDWGHCDKGNIQHSKKQSTAACGFWCDGLEETDYE